MSNTNTPTARLTKSEGSWQMEWLSEPEREETILLFGEPIIPTAYGERLPFWMVVNNLAAIPANGNVQFVDGTR